MKLNETSAEVLDLYETALAYKEEYPTLAKFHRDRGLPPRLPHSDDVHLNYKTGTVTITGPRNHEELDILKENT